MKYEWRKEEKEFYLPKKIDVLDIPEYNYITLTGQGNPNESDFSEHIQALYPIAYSIRMYLKKNESFEYTVYPLEGIWTTSDGSKNETLNKDALEYKIMIRQPNQVTEELFNQCRQSVIMKKKNKYFEDVKLEKYSDGKAIQVLHNGSFDEEINSFNLMHEYMNANNLEKTTIMDNYQHREIYLSDFRKTTQDKLKTVLRYKLK